MPCLFKSSASESDLTEIAMYIGRDNPEAAMRLLERFQRTLEMLLKNPLVGQSRDDLAPGLRLYPVQNYLLLYRVAPDGIDLLRVLHGARNVKAVLRSSKQ